MPTHPADARLAARIIHLTGLLDQYRAISVDGLYPRGLIDESNNDQLDNDE